MSLTQIVDTMIDQGFAWEGCSSWLRYPGHIPAPFGATHDCIVSDWFHSMVTHWLGITPVEETQCLQVRLFLAWSTSNPQHMRMLTEEAQRVTPIRVWWSDEYDRVQVLGTLAGAEMTPQALHRLIGDVLEVALFVRHTETTLLPKYAS